MFELSVERRFCASHALMIRGTREAMHSHEWVVTARVRGPRLDPDGLLCDFHAIEVALDRILEPFQNSNLHELSLFSARNPSAENVARVLAEELSLCLNPTLPAGVRVESVRVTEAPGCTAEWWADGSAADTGGAIG